MIYTQLGFAWHTSPAASCLPWQHGEEAGQHGEEAGQHGEGVEQHVEGAGQHGEKAKQRGVVGENYLILRTTTRCYTVMGIWVSYIYWGARKNAMPSVGIVKT